MAVSKSLRFQIMRRDNNTCRYCGGTAPDVTLTIDHVVPTTLGGSDDPSNLVAACRDCNAGKSATPADAARVREVATDAVRWAAAMRWATEEVRMDRETRRATEDWFEQAWTDWRTEGGMTCPMPADWRRSLEQFLDAGLTEEDIAECIQIAMGRGKPRGEAFRYFCGVCWRTVSERQAMAKSFIDAREEPPAPRRDGWSDYLDLQATTLFAVCDSRMYRDLEAAGALE